MRAIGSNLGDSAVLGRLCAVADERHMPGECKGSGPDAEKLTRGLSDAIQTTIITYHKRQPDIRLLIKIGPSAEVDLRAIDTERPDARANFARAGLWCLHFCYLKHLGSPRSGEIKPYEPLSFF